MINKISQDLQSLALPIEQLLPLEKNPRRGNIGAIASSYNEFGQMKPIVVRPNSDGTYTVIAGNHQLEAAKRLGWTEIAAVQMDVPDETAIAYALADNRTMELGHTDPRELSDLLIDVYDSYPELLEDLGWDEFEMAAMEESQIAGEVISPIAGGYVPPVVMERPQAPTLNVEEDEEGERKIVANRDIDHREVAVSGSTVVAPGSAPQAVVQYTLVFDNPDQQRRWYEFIRWLRNDPGTDGNTTSEKLINFLDSVADY
jgi:hypothetical protein